MSENSTSSTDHSKQKSTGKRKYHQKSRLGCSTCKKRRVKCDETRPTCKKCQHMDLVCGYTLEDQTPPKDGSLPLAKKKSEPMAKKRRVKEEDGLSDSIGNSRSSSVSSSDSQTQQATPAITPSPSYTDQQSQSQQDPQPPQPQKAKPFYHNLLNAGNLNNLNLSHLVNNLSGLGDLSNLGSLTSLGNLATLAQLPIDLSSLGGNSPQLTSQPQQQPQSQSQQQQQQQQQQPQQSQQASVQAQVAAAAMNSNPLMNLGNLFAAGSNDFSQFMKSQGSSTNTTQARPQRQHQQQQQNQQAQQQNQQAQQQQQQQQQNQQQNQQQPQAQARTQAQGQDTQPSISPNVNTSNPPPLGNSPLNHPMAGIPNGSSLNMLDLRLMFHYTSQVSNTITGAGISDTNIWNHDIPMLAFNYPFLMHSILAFSATHLSRTEKGLDQCVTCHRGDALRLLREAVLDINNDNTDALVASALILIMDSLANASFPSSTSPKSLPASAWIFHVKGAATILTAVWPLTEQSRFYKFISVDLGDLGDIPNQQRESKDKSNPNDIKYFTDLECHDSDIADLFPVEIESPYLITLAYLNKLHKERYKSDFILRIFAFPALLDKNFLSLLMTGDIKAMRIMRSYYKLLRSFTTEMKDKVWFLEGVSQVLPVDVEEYAGGAGGMHMMLDFLGGGPSIIDDHEIDEEIGNFDPSGVLTNKLIDTNNLPSDITSNLDVMQGDSGFMNIK